MIKEDVKQLLSVMKMSEFEVIEQLKKMPAQNFSVRSLQDFKKPQNGTYKTS